MTYFAKQTEDGFLENSYGYKIKVDPGLWTVCGHTGPIRTHNGFAVFSTEEQAKWAIELMGHSAYYAEEKLQDAIKKLLGIEEKQEEIDQ